MSDSPASAYGESTILQPITFHPIGLVRSPFASTRGMPIQPTAARGVPGTVDLLPGYAEGLRDLDGFSHIILLYHFHRARPPELTVRPYLDQASHGVFSTRAPARPNAIGLSIVRLLAIEGKVLRIEDVDILDGTPVLDIKPYVPGFDVRAEARSGWLQDKLGKLNQVQDDGRFAEQ